jgi:hypothetical protein
VVWEGNRTDFFVAIDFELVTNFCAFMEQLKPLTYCNLTDDILTAEDLANIK